MSTDPVTDHAERVGGLKSSLTEAIGCLPERQQLILALYYQEDLGVPEIGEITGDSLGRVSQLHAEALISLRAAARAGDLVA